MNWRIQTRQPLPLCDPGIGQLRYLTHAEHFPARLCDHRSVVNAEPSDQIERLSFAFETHTHVANGENPSHLSSVAKRWAPLSSHMTPIISCRRRLPAWGSTKHDSDTESKRARQHSAESLGRVNVSTGHSQPTPPTMRTSWEPQWAMARSVISTSIEKRVSCRSERVRPGQTDTSRNVKCVTVWYREEDFSSYLQGKAQVLCCALPRTQHLVCHLLDFNGKKSTSDKYAYYKNTHKKLFLREATWLK